MRVIEGGKQARLVPEAGLNLGVLREHRWQPLDGDVALEAEVTSRQDDSPGAAAKLIADVVTRQRGGNCLTFGIKNRAHGSSLSSQGPLPSPAGWLICVIESEAEETR